VRNEHAFSADLFGQPEVWLPIPDFPRYEVSNFGRIRRIGGRILKPSASKGYLHVSLCRNGEISTKRVHVIVLSAFCGRAPFEGAQAAHNDGNPLNCALTNLRWATAVENQADVDRHGHRCKGSEVFGAVLDEERVAQIRSRIAAGERNPSLAAAFGVSISTIHLIRHRKIWRHVQ
jgi:hypothetical protein